MGGTTFETTGMDPDVGKAFHIAREQAGYEHGHGGYSGTIQEKHDFVVITNTPVPYAVAEVQAGTLIDADDPRIRDKWGPAGAGEGQGRGDQGQDGHEVHRDRHAATAVAERDGHTGRGSGLRRG
jgi:hypothetical protein